MRTTSGNSIFPPVRQRYRPTCVMSWSRQGYENASYCISQTGRQPAMQSPTALPRIPASASGVSKHRSGPKRSRRPAVARKTPPARPTSSPMTMTVASRSSSTWNASLIASTMLSSAKRPPQLVEIRPERSRRIGEGVFEQELDVGGLLRLGGSDALAQQVCSLGTDRSGEIVVQDPGATEVALEAPHALPLLLLLHAREIDVGAGIVRGRMRRRSIGDRLEKRRPLAGPGARDRFARRFLASEHVRPVDPQARHGV